MQAKDDQLDLNCGPEVKLEVAKLLEEYGYHKNPQSLQSQWLKKALFEQYQFCADDKTYNPDHNDKDSREYCGDLSFVASTAYERMRCCGYDPQKQQFACPVEITLPNGFGAAHFPGSYEYVLTCVDFNDGAGFIPVASDRVHLANEIYGVKPDWALRCNRKCQGKTRRSTAQGPNTYRTLHLVLEPRNPQVVTMGISSGATRLTTRLDWTHKKERSHDL